MSLDRIFWAAAAGSLALDRATKALVQARFALGESLPLWPGTALTYVRNPGAAFSFLAGQDASFRRPFFLCVTAAALAAVAWTLKHTPKGDRMARAALGLIAGGALGNAVDRASHGEVVDFIEVGLPGVFTWPIFNGADSAIFIGVCLLAWRAFRPLEEAASA